MNYSRVKLGKLPARHDPRTPQFAEYVNGQLSQPKPSLDWSARVKKWGMMGNDRIGNSTCAAAGHLISVWTANAGRPVVPTEAAIVDAYGHVAGYKRGNPSTDRGANVLDVLNYWRCRGIGGHKILAYAALEPGNRTQVMDAICLFGNCYIGLALPLSARTQDVWAVPPGGPTGPGAPWSWGGHAVAIVGYDSRTLTAVTWGTLKKMTWEFWEVYCDEVYAVLNKDFIEARGGSPRGFDLKALLAALGVAFVAKSRVRLQKMSA